MSGIIALDIDGTSAVSGKAVSEEVASYLSSLYEKGWSVIFITGRMFAKIDETLHNLRFPYYIAAQNGAVIVEMPSRLIVYKCYLDRSFLPTFEEVCKEEGTDVVVCLGMESDDRVYFRPDAFQPTLKNYLERRIKSYQENWMAVESFDQIQENVFSALKCFGSQESLRRIVQHVLSFHDLHMPIIRDPFSWDPASGEKEFTYLVQATHGSVSKGATLKQFSRMVQKEAPLIAAGDDWNDLSMLEAANIRIVMETAPEELRQIAHVEAPSIEKGGIIHGLELALNMSGSI